MQNTHFCPHHYIVIQGRVPLGTQLHGSTSCTAGATGKQKLETIINFQKLRGPLRDFAVLSAPFRWSQR